MPFIDLKITVPVDEKIKEELKSDLGLAITALHKTETYLMVGIDDNYDLWLGGTRLDKGAYVSVSLYGSASSSDYDTMTGKICDILESRLSIPGDKVYVTYRGVNDWGWNGRNF
ncbi:Macrophage migration inhibitory factor (MIF) [Ruminococcaceae bacterium YRB3002]|nr:Macrophage migration inhibitory factor (MIF) [Ruminococcaceae bacterium YRB3002]